MSQMSLTVIEIPTRFKGIETASPNRPRFPIIIGELKYRPDLRGLKRQPVNITAKAAKLKYRPDLRGLKLTNLYYL